MTARTLLGIPPAQPCGCGGYGCENCANPADYCREYEPAFDGPELTASANVRTDEEAEFWSDLRQRIAEALYLHDQPGQVWQQADAADRRRYHRAAAAVLPVLPDRGRSGGLRLYPAVRGLTQPVVVEQPDTQTREADRG